MRAILPAFFLLFLFSFFSPPAFAQPFSVAPALAEVERLAQEQKYQAALDQAREVLQKALAKKDDDLATEALIQVTQLEMGLHGYETAVRIFKETPWPKGGESRLLLNLYYAQSLMIYEQQYGWEIRGREKTASKGTVDLKAWTSAEIGQEISRAFDAAMAEGAWLEGEIPGYFQAYLHRNNYPSGVRPTIRDAVVYLTVQHLANQQFWQAKELSEIYRLPLARLASGQLDRHLPAAGGEAHPLEKIASWLGELARFHGKKGRQEAAIEARYVLLETLYQSFTEEGDRAELLKSLRTLQAEKRNVGPWWARGQALLARWQQEESGGDRLIRARKEAILGRDAYPGSPGAQMCQAIIFEIERPTLILRSMASDRPSKPSLQLEYRNLRKVYFRAYRQSLESVLQDGKKVGFWGIDQQKILSLVRANEKPEASWQVELEETKDYDQHRKLVTPPALKPGIYWIVSSLRDDFKEPQNQVNAASLIVTDLVLTAKPVSGAAMEVRALSGESGLPQEGVKVDLYRFTWQSQLEIAETQKTDANGYARFKESGKKSQEYPTYFFLAKKGESLAVERENIWFGHEEEARSVMNAFVYTDRAIYRPNQKLYFKLVAYSGKSSEGRYSVARAGETLLLKLFDPNRQEVSTAQLKLNSFGSASGEFIIPAGRPLGRWTLETVGRYGSASVKVEEYKRPTFEPKLKEAADPFRLNRKATIRGEARYYFGLPVTAGEVHWRVTRAEVAPWWWQDWGWWRPVHRRAPETVAAGKTLLGADGSFTFDFIPQADERKSKAPEGGGLSYRFEVEVDVTDEGGETRTASRSFRLGFVAVETRLEAEAGFFQPNRRASVRAQLSDLDGKPLAGEGNYRLARLEGGATRLPADLPLDTQASEFSLPGKGLSNANGDREYSLPDDSKRARWETSFQWQSVTRLWKEAEKIAEGKVVHNAKGEGVIELPSLAKSGVYRLTYTTKDAFGASFIAFRDFIVGDSQPSLNLPLVVEAKNGSRKVGESARFIVHSGLPNQELALEWYRGGKQISRSFLKMGKGSSLVEVPVKAEDRGGFTLVVSGLRDFQPLRAETNLQVPWSDRELKVEFSTFRDKLQPGEKENFRITVKNDKGNVLERGGAEVLSYMYDRSLDLFGSHVDPSVLSLYPNRTGAPREQWSVGAGQSTDLFSNLASPPGMPSFSPDQLEVYPRYGIGGPGQRGGGRFGIMMEAAGDMAGMSRSAMAPMAANMASASGAMKKEGIAGGAKLESAAAPAPEQAATPIALRSNFSETAYFAPHLLTGDDGSASVEFTAPDSVTSWKVIAHALTKDMRGGSATRETSTVKELMVRPYAPRFLREGDEAEIRVQVNNAGDKALSGELTFEIEEEGKSAMADFQLKGSAKKPFSVEKNGSVTLGFPLKAPKRVGEFSFRVTARAKGLSDGERRPFPVLPSRMHLAQSRFVALHHKDSKVLEFKDLAANDDPSRINEQLVVAVDAQLFYGVLQALPYLVKYPYECSEQILNRFVSTGILSSLFKKFPSVAKMAEGFSKRETRFERFDDKDPNRRMQLEESPWLQEAQGGAKGEDPLANVLNPEAAKAERDQALAKLRKMQLPNGGFPWFQGGPPDEHMTIYLLLGLSRALEFQVEIPKDMIIKAWSFVRQHLDEHLSDMLAKDYGWETVTMVNFTLSSYPSDAWTGGFFDQEYRKKLLDFSFRHWKEHAPLLKGYLALTLKRLNRAGDAKLVWDSVMDSAKYDDQLGTFWAREDRSWLWYNDTIETHAFALRTQMELDEKNKHNEGIVQWLFLNKKLNHWKSTRATAEVLYALTHYLNQTNQLGQREEVQVDLGTQKAEFSFDPEKYTGKKNLILVPGEKMDSKKSSRIIVTKSSPGFAFASATWHFSTDKLPKEDSGDFFQVSRKYFRREHVGNEWQLKPLSEGAAILVGDQIEVQLSLRTKHEAEYVHLRDPRGAGFEPESLTSGYRWDLGLSWYEEIRDSGANFFFNRLPVGEFTFKYRLRANMAGNFRVGPAEVQSMYAPEFNAYSAGQLLKVESK